MLGNFFSEVRFEHRNEAPRLLVCACYSETLGHSWLLVPPPAQ